MPVRASLVPIKLALGLGVCGSAALKISGGALEL